MNNTNSEVTHWGLLYFHCHLYWAQIFVSASSILSRHSFRNVRDHVAQTHSTTENIVFTYFNFQILRSREEKYMFGLNNNTNFLPFVYILFPREYKFNLSTMRLTI